MSKSIEVSTKTFVRFWLVIIAFGIGLLLLQKALPALIIIGLAIFLAVALTPIAKKLTRSKNSTGLSAGLTVGGIVLVVGMIFSIAAPVIISETSKFISRVPEQLQDSGSWAGINEFGHSIGIDNIQEQAVTIAKNFANSFANSDLSSTVFSSISTIANIATASVLTMVLTILFMTQGPAMLDELWKLIGHKDKSAAKVTRHITERLAKVISKYVTGQVTVAILDGLVTSLVVFILSLCFGFSSELAVPMGLIAMVFYLIPMFGPIITCFLVSLILFFQIPAAGAIFLVFYAIYSQIENNVISPKIQGNSLDLPSVAILVAITIGMYMFGLLGAIISIPIAGCIKVLIEEYPKIRDLTD